MDDLFDNGSDVDMLSSQSSSCSSSSQKSTLSAANEKVIKFIGYTFDHVYSELDRRPSEDVYVELERVASTRTSQHPRLKVQERKARYYWPGETAKEAWRFSQ